VCASERILKTRWELTKLSIWAWCTTFWNTVYSCLLFCIYQMHAVNSRNVTASLTSSSLSHWWYRFDSIAGSFDFVRWPSLIIVRLKRVLGGCRKSRVSRPGRGRVTARSRSVTGRGRLPSSCCVTSEPACDVTVTSSRQHAARTPGTTRARACTMNWVSFVHNLFAVVDSSVTTQAVNFKAEF